MLKKLFVTAAAAAALTVPLAGAAWAEPPEDPGSNSDGIGAGGIPGKVGLPFGEVISSDGTATPPIAKADGSVPDAISDVNGLPRVGPGQYVKRVTPGCGNGAATNPTNSCG